LPGTYPAIQKALVQNSLVFLIGPRRAVLSPLVEAVSGRRRALDPAAAWLMNRSGPLRQLGRTLCRHGQDRAFPFILTLLPLRYNLCHRRGLKTRVGHCGFSRLGTVASGRVDAGRTSAPQRTARHKRLAVLPPRHGSFCQHHMTFCGLVRSSGLYELTGKGISRT
jgi:hypothetical protein